MFGYIKPFTPELKVKEHEAFKAVYCGLCHQLGRSFGVAARLTLSYDFVFLAMLYYAQAETPPQVQPGRCCVNPLIKVPLCQQDSGLEYSADVAGLMIYYKIQDNIADSRGLKKKGWQLASRMVRSRCHKAAERQPAADKVLAQMIEEQQAVERQQLDSVDAACQPTANALSLLAGDLVDREDPARPTWERLGYLVGRYIYLCDALEDVEDDLKTGNYNPLVRRHLTHDQRPEAVERARQGAKDALYMTIGEMGNLLGQIEFAYFAPILHNIIQYGMRFQADQLFQRKVDNP